MNGDYDLRLHEDYLIKTFLRCVDCPDLNATICDFWEREIKSLPA